MGDKFDAITGKFSVKLNGKEYPFLMSIRHRAKFASLRDKNDKEAIILFLFDRFEDYFCKVEKPDATKGDLDAYQQILNNEVFIDTDSLFIEVLIALKFITREEIENISKLRSDPDFLSESLLKKKN